ncbi:hypothetical protein PIB30_029960 [Stylosanthes scabra]|uniref:Uncharacterized protein n=1 Tax=Stylosanthes scabra TaxID=79078 RepID=A0ABU6X9J6_9FABA|nr:hypothetical protein [Stylosanthes scabra]
MKGKFRKARLDGNREPFLPDTLERTERKHDRERFLLLDSMTCDLLCSQSQLNSCELNCFVGLAFTAKTGAEVAKNGEMNEEVVKKTLKADSAAYANAPKHLCIRIALTSASRPELGPDKCVRT